jgi:nuclear pore complex protein Nup53
LQSSLADPSGFLSDHLSGAKIDELPFRPAGTSAGLGASSAAFFQGDEWGYDKQYWVTVYGFPANSKSFILQHFQTLGDVISYTSGAGNWLHMRYHTRLQAEKALSHDGTLLGGAIMVGVKKCLPSQLEGVRQEPTSTLYFSHARKNPGSKCVPAVGSDVDEERLTCILIGCRDLEVDPIREEDLMLPPRRRQDICSRLLGFLFNW